MPAELCSERVAIIAVHGVADQPAGATALQLAELLVAAPDLAYRLDGSQALALHVQPLPAMPEDERLPQPTRATQAPAAPAGGSPGTPATQAAADRPTPSGPRPLGKALAQSFGSDFHRHHWVASGRPLDHGLAAGTAGTAGAPAAPAAPATGDTPAAQAAQPAAGLQDPGTALSDFLLFKAWRNRTLPQAYGTTRLDLQRRSKGADGGATAQDVHVYEMYWADLSRLSGSLPRIVTEFFTMVFRLSQLGRDTVRVAARQFGTTVPDSRRWRWLATWQAGLDWAFSKGLALVTLQMLMAALVIVPMGLAAQVEGFAPRSRDLASVVLPLAAALWYLYRFRKTAASAAGALLALAGLVLLLRLPPADWVVGLGWLVALSVAYDAFMRVCDARFPFTRAPGWALWALVATGIVLTAAFTAAHPADGLNQPLGLHLWVIGALRSLEFILLANIVWWGLAGAALAVWFVLGQAAARQHGYEGRASVATGRLALFASMGLFVILTMAAWAALTGPLSLSVPGTRYLPLVFGDGRVEAAAAFLEARYQNSTEMFALVAMLMVVLLVHLVLTLLPSVLAEAQWTHAEPGRLGRWLTFGYRYLDFSVMVLVALAVLAALVTGALLVAGRLDPGLLERINRQVEWLPVLSQTILKPLIFSAASAMLAFSVLGRVLSRYVPWLRAPLDIALDVDNHFREFPRQAIPRARIFSRYVALLQHVAQQGYDRVVIVAHSQGTVISTELLRYLKLRAGHAAARPGSADPAAALWAALTGRLYLLTAGSPLRQLYAARFPTLYRWVLQDQAGRLGPSAAGLGVQRWINAYTTGDYIGRWLWSRPAQPGRDVSEVQVDEVACPGDVYQPATGAGTGGGPAELDVCVGPGAHTHYFDPDQHKVAMLIDRLVAGRQGA